MSGFILFKVYDSLNFQESQYKNLNDIKELLLQKLENNYFVIDKFGHEYQKDNLNKIQINKTEKFHEFIIHNTTDFYTDSVYDNLTKEEIRDKILIQINIDGILNQYLKAKKGIIEKSFSIIKEIDEKCKEIKEEGCDNLEQHFSGYAKNNEEFKKIVKIYNQSLSQINELSPKYKENIEDIEKMYNETINEIDNNINNTFGGKPKYNIDDINELKNTFNSFNSYIREKISKIINGQQLTYNLESKINELLIYAEKINFYVNLNEIPKMYEAFKPKLDEEIKRRSYFQCIYNIIIEFLNSNFISEEFELRKKFFKTNCKISEKTKMEKKTIDILNKLIDIEQEKMDEELKKKIDYLDLNNLGSELLLEDNDDIDKEKYEFDEDILKYINNIKFELNGFKGILYSKNKNKKNKEGSDINKPLDISKERIKNEVNNKFQVEIEEIKNNLRNFSVPELGQKKIMDIIENKIFKSMSNLNENKKTDNEVESMFSYEIKENYTFNKMGSEIFLSENNPFNKNVEDKDKVDINKIAKYFTDTYSRFLWFYNKVYEYLFIFTTNSGKNYGIQLNKEDPYSINNCLVEILNENKKLEEKLKRIKGIMKNYQIK